MERFLFVQRRAGSTCALENAADWGVVSLPFSEGILTLDSGKLELYAFRLREVSEFLRCDCWFPVDAEDVGESGKHRGPVVDEQFPYAGSWFTCDLRGIMVVCVRINDAQHGINIQSDEFHCELVIEHDLVGWQGDLEAKWLRAIFSANFACLSDVM